MQSDYKHSRLISEDEYTDWHLCGRIPLRQHVHPELETDGARQAQKDWSRLVAPLDTERYAGSLGRKWGFTALAIPEALPERLWIISYVMEFGVLYDDFLELQKQDKILAENRAFLNGLAEAFVADENDIQRMDAGRRQMQAQVLHKMVTLDRERALVALDAWKKFISKGSGTKYHKSWSTFDEWLDYRLVDIGHMFLHAVFVFGCAITIPPEEEQLANALSKPCIVAMTLQNDYFSFDKEYVQAQQQGDAEVPNSVWVLMKEHRIPLDEAKERLVKIIIEEVAKYEEILAKLPDRTDLSPDTLKYVELWQYFLSANCVWSMDTPRYQRVRWEGIHSIPQYPEAIFAARPLQDLTFPPTPVISEDGKDGMQVGSTPILQIESSGVPVPDAMDKFPAKKTLPRLSDRLVLEPHHYLAGLPSKGIRKKITDALNYWLDVPFEIASSVGTIVEQLHGSSLMLEDHQDRSPLRRGKPSTHMIYGPAQTINSATFVYVDTFSTISQLSAEHPGLLAIFCEEVRGLFIGQSYDLYWTRHNACPSEKEYLQMIDGKKGGLFRLLTKLMVEMSPHKTISKLDGEFDRFSCLFSRYFHIRDGYLNLTSPDCTAQKGFCENLDGGKYSLPLIHCIQHCPRSSLLMGIFEKRREDGCLGREMKDAILAEMKATGSLEYTLKVLKEMYGELDEEVTRLEGVFGKENIQLRVLVALLNI